VKSRAASFIANSSSSNAKSIANYLIRLNFLAQFHGSSMVPRNEKRLIFNHRCILKEIVKFVNKVENKQKERWKKRK
jgi:hypothetical protein